MKYLINLNGYLVITEDLLLYSDSIILKRNPRKLRLPVSQQWITRIQQIKNKNLISSSNLFNVNVLQIINEDKDLLIKFKFL